MSRPRKLTDIQIQGMREQFATGATAKVICQNWGVSLQTAYNIKNKKGSYAEEVVSFTSTLNPHGQVTSISNEEIEYEDTEERSQN